MPVSKELAKILVCPKCQGKVIFAEDENGVICKKCSLKYPINENIPIMLIDSAVSLSDGASDT